MKTFKQYCENMQKQEDAVSSALNHLCYAKRYSPEFIASMPIEQLSSDIQTLGLLPTTSWPIPRFAAMLKLKARLIGNGEALSPVAPRGDQ